MFPLAVSLLIVAEVMSTPGANRSKQLPTLENTARASVPEVAPTVIASATRGGDWVQASRSSLPAALTHVTPAATAARTASSSAGTTERCRRLMLTTAGFSWLVVTQSMPATHLTMVVLPKQSSTRT